MATLLLALVSNLVAVGMALQQICELPGNTDVTGDGGLQLTARPPSMPEAQRNSSQFLALEVPDGTPQLRQQGGVVEAGADDPEIAGQQGARAGGEARGRKGGRGGGGGVMLRRSETCDDLALMPMTCQTTGHRALDWTNMARLTACPGQHDVDLLRYRHINHQCQPGSLSKQFHKHQA